MRGQLLFNTFVDQHRPSAGKVREGHTDGGVGDNDADKAVGQGEGSLGKLGPFQHNAFEPRHAQGCTSRSKERSQTSRLGASLRASCDSKGSEWTHMTSQSHAVAPGQKSASEYKQGRSE